MISMYGRKYEEAPISKGLMNSDGNSIKPRRRALLDNLSDLVDFRNQENQQKVKNPPKKR
jgi:hypothetical protein